MPLILLYHLNKLGVISMRYAVAILFLFSTPAFAQLHGGDVELTVVNNQIVTDARVYAAEFGDAGVPNEIDEPGFDNLAGAFPSGSSIGFSIRDSLREWDGTGFDAIPAETISVNFGTSLGPITTPAASGVVDGFDLNVASDGSWHRHYDFVLDSPASTGVYLLQLQLDSSDAGIAPTDPFFIVFNQNDTEQNHDAAIEFVDAFVPEPSSFVLAVLASCAGLSIGGGRATRKHRLRIPQGHDIPFEQGREYWPVHL